MSKTEQRIRLKDGRILGFAEYGDLSGKPLFFFHGWPNSRLHGEVMHHAALKLHIRVIATDRPGYGISEYKKNRILLDWADDVLALAGYLGIQKFAILGNSGGGPYAAVCAYKMPERITKVGIVVGLAPTDIEGVLHGMAYINKLGWRNYRRFPFIIFFASLLLYIRVKLMPGLMKFDFNSSSDKDILSQTSLTDIIRRRQEAFRQGMKGPARDLELYSHAYGFSFQDITVPVFLWYGDEDKKVSLEMGRYYALQTPGSTLHIYPREGHMILNKHTEEILRTLIK